MYTLLDPALAYKDLPEPPSDSYRWDRFFEDQTSRPLIFHGTSSIHEDSIRKYGLALDTAPYDPREIAEVVKIFNRYRIYGDAEYPVATLQAFTASSAQTNSISFTFDYPRACSYTMMYQCGETVCHLWHLLNWALDPPKASFTEFESSFLTNYRHRIAPMVNAHKPMVVAVEFAIEDFVVDDFPNKDLAFFFDRNVFVKLLNDGVGPAWFLGYYAPRRLWRGHEYRATKAILPERIRHVLFPKTSSDRRCW